MNLTIEINFIVENTPVFFVSIELGQEVPIVSEADRENRLSTYFG